MQETEYLTLGGRGKRVSACGGRVHVIGDSPDDVRAARALDPARMSSPYRLDERFTRRRNSPTGCEYRRCDVVTSGGYSYT